MSDYKIRRLAKQAGATVSIVHVANEHRALGTVAHQFDSVLQWESKAGPITAALLLDFDRVITTPASWYDATGGRELPDTELLAVAPKALDPELVGRVQYICNATDAGILIVSGWRRHMSLEVMSDALRAAGLTTPILGVVGVKMSGDLRARGAREWLDEHPEIVRWCVLDDKESYWLQSQSYTRQIGKVTLSGYEQHVPDWLDGGLVCPVDGVTPENAEAAIVALQRVRR